MQQTALDTLLAPLSTAGFMADHWLKKPLHQSGAADRFAALLGEKDLEYLAATLPAPHPSFVTLVRDGAVLPATSLTRLDSKLDIHKFRQARAAGHTLLLAQLNRRWPAISALCVALEGALREQGVALSHPIVANAYATPAGARGFTVHHDDHEVLVMQIAGAKRWRFYQPLNAPPILQAHRILRPEQYGMPQREIEMKPGDFLYIPRGTPHDASANTDSTLHLTLSVNVRIWSDVVANLMRVDPLFRAALPAVRGGSQAQAAAWSAELARRIAQLDGSPRAMGAVAAGFDDEFAAALDPALQMTAPPVAAARPLGPQSRLAHAAGSFLQFDSRADGVALLFPGGTQMGPAAHAATFRFIAEHPSFTVAELPGLPDDAKLRLAGELVRQGALVAA